MEVICCKGPPGFETMCDPAFWPYNKNNSCDIVMKNYCENNQYDPVCACMVSDKPFPQCQDTNCQKNGYIPSNLKEIKCPNIIQCNQDVSNIEVNTGGEIKLNQIQICGDDPKIKEILKKDGEEGILKVLDAVYDTQMAAQEEAKVVELSIFEKYKYFILVFLLFIIAIIIIKVKSVNKNLE